MTMIYNGANYDYLFYLADEVNGRSPVTGEALNTTVEYAKPGGSVTAIVDTVTEIGEGWYSITIPTSGVLASYTGDLALQASASGGVTDSRVWRDKVHVVPWNPEDAADLGVTALVNLTTALASGIGLSATAIDNIWAEAIENDDLGSPTLTAAQLMRGIFAHSTGLATRSAAGNGNLLQYTSPDGTVSRIEHQVTTDGERTSVTYNLDL
jgi:hypothetical protein